MVCLQVYLKKPLDSCSWSTTLLLESSVRSGEWIISVQLSDLYTVKDQLQIMLLVRGPKHVSDLLLCYEFPRSISCSPLRSSGMDKLSVGQMLFTSFYDALHVLSNALSCFICLRYCVKHFELLFCCNAPNKTTLLPCPGMTDKSIWDGQSWLFWRNSNWF